jgi:hypothetical protein
MGTAEPPHDADAATQEEGLGEQPGGEDIPLPSDDGHPSFLQHPVSFLSWWWTKKPPNNLTTLIVGVLTTLVLAGLTVAVGVLITLLVGAGNVPGYALAIAAGVGLAIGLLVAWRITVAFYELKLRLSERTHELLVQRLEEALEEERRKLLELEPDRKALRRLGAYTDYAYALIESLLRGKVSLGDMDGAQANRDICEVPQALLRKVTGQDYYMSVWVEGATGIRGGIHWLAEALPIGEALPERLLKFDVVCAPDHTIGECEAFSVSVDESWLKWNHRQELKRKEERVYQVDKLPFVGLPGDDLEAFEAHGYRSVRATSFDRSGATGYLVILAKAELAFSQTEERLLLWLRHALELDVALHPPTAA